MAGARQGVLWLFVIPMIFILFWLVLFKRGQLADGALLIPGILMTPVYLHLLFLRGRCVPLSIPPEESKSTRQGLMLTSMYLISFPITLSAAFAKYAGYYWQFLAIEGALGSIAVLWMRRRIRRAEWKTDRSE